MEELYKLKQTLCNELEEYSKKEKMSAGDLDVVDKLSHTIKNIDKIIEKYDEDEYSGMGGYSNRMSYTRGGNGYSNERMMDRNYSMARGGRGRGSNARRDSMGRYTSRRGGMSYDDGMIEELRDLMDRAPDEPTRREFQKLVTKLEQM